MSRVFVRTVLARAAVLLVIVVAVAACTRHAPTTSAPSASTESSSAANNATSPSVDAASADWPTFGHDNGRSGIAPAFPHVTQPKIAWRTRLDGAVYGQPIVIGDMAFAATENDTVYALDLSTGAVMWSQHVGTPVPLGDLPCGNIDPLGITSTMGYDAASHAIFAVAETSGGAHTLYGFDARTGKLVQRRNVDPPHGDRLAHQQRSALTVLGGHVYVAYGGLNGDCGRYIGSIVAAPTHGDGATFSYAIPTSREGGIWAPGGGAVSGSHLLYAVGNGESTSAYDGSDSVIALDQQLRLVDRFAPQTWAADNAGDLDLGSMSPAVVGQYVFADGKRGTGYVLAGKILGGIGGDVAHADVCPAYGAAAVSGSMVYIPCADGTRAIRIGPDGAITPIWHTSAPANGPPVLAGGSLWALDWNGGVLYLLDPASGAVRSQVTIGSLPHFASPTLAHGRVLIGTMTGVVELR